MRYGQNPTTWPSCPPLQCMHILLMNVEMLFAAYQHVYKSLGYDPLAD